jgi:hypothetical protein
LPWQIFFFGSWSAASIQGRKIFKGGNYCFLNLISITHKVKSISKNMYLEILQKQDSDWLLKYFEQFQAIIFFF